MLDIPGIGSDQVERYGQKFLPLIHNAKRGYEAMIDSENCPQDPNHQTVISISSDEGKDFDAGTALDDLDDAEESQGELSHYFEHDHDVQAFNAQSKSSWFTETKSL